MTDISSDLEVTEVTPTHAHLRRTWDWSHQWITWLLDVREKSFRGDIHFSWDPSEQAAGGYNCLTLASENVKILTGKDLHTELASDYSTALGAYKVIRQKGFRDVDGLLESIFNSKLPHFAIQGDLVTVKVGASDLPEEVNNTNTEHGIMKAIGIADPPFFWCIMPAGLGRGSMEDVIDCYSVGG